MNRLKRTPYSLLNLAPVQEGSSVADALQQMLGLAERAESLGFERFWVAEHHNFRGVASSATAVLVGQLAARTTRIKVGSGGIMLPNHAPLVVAEQFGTLEALYPGRIDLGIGRAPGTDPLTARALRRDRLSNGEDFPEQLAELRAYLGKDSPGSKVRAIPGVDSNVPVWLLGSSLFSAQLAAQLGLPYAFAAHFAPRGLMEALELYRRLFQPSHVLSKPYAMACIPVVAAETDERARYLFTSLQQRFLALVRGQPIHLVPPVESMNGRWNEGEQASVNGMLKEAIVGSPDTIAAALSAFLERTGVDEIMMTTDSYAYSDRVRTLEVVAEVMGP